MFELVPLFILLPDPSLPASEGALQSLQGGYKNVIFLPLPCKFSQSFFLNPIMTTRAGFWRFPWGVSGGPCGLFQGIPSTCLGGPRCVFQVMPTTYCASFLEVFPWVSAVSFRECATRVRCVFPGSDRSGPVGYPQWNSGKVSRESERVTSGLGPRNSFPECIGSEYFRRNGIQDLILPDSWKRSLFPRGGGKLYRCSIWFWCRSSSCELVPLGKNGDLVWTHIIVFSTFKVIQKVHFATDFQFAGWPCARKTILLSKETALLQFLSLVKLCQPGDIPACIHMPLHLPHDYMRIPHMHIPHLVYRLIWNNSEVPKPTHLCTGKVSCMDLHFCTYQ